MEALQPLVVALGRRRHVGRSGRSTGMINGTCSLDSLRGGSGERAITVLLALRGNRNQYELALNIPNDGYIRNLPDECSRRDAGRSQWRQPSWLCGGRPASHHRCLGGQPGLCRLPGVNTAVSGDHAVGVAGVSGDQRYRDRREDSRRAPVGASGVAAAVCRVMVCVSPLAPLPD